MWSAFNTATASHTAFVYELVNQPFALPINQESIIFSWTNKALRRPVQVRLKSGTLLGMILLLILLIFNLSAALILSTIRCSSSSMLTWGSLRDCPPPVTPHLSDITEGSIVRVASPLGSPRARSGSTSPSFSNQAAWPCTEIAKFLYRTILISLDESIAALVQTAQRLGDSLGNRLSLRLTLWSDPAGVLCTHPSNQLRPQQWLKF